MDEHKYDNKSGPIEQIQHYWYILIKWKYIASIFFFAVFLAALLYSFLATPIYKATGSMWIEDEPNILPFEEFQTLGAQNNLKSHSILLQSRTLADNIIEQLLLYQNPEFGGSPTMERESYVLSESVFRERLIDRFVASIDVEPIGGTSLVEVNFSNRNPKLAADILNALLAGYIDMLVSKRYMASELATEFLNSQIATLQAEVTEQENDLSEYGSEEDILPLTATETPTISRLSDVNKRLTDATILRIDKLNYYNQLNSAPIAEISDTSNNQLIQSLRLQVTTLSREYSKMLANLRPEYPEMQRLKTELDAATDALTNETENLIRSAYSDYLNALNAENSLKKLVEQQKNEAFKVNSKSVVYNSMQIELENKKSLLETLTKRKSETDMSTRLKGLEAINVWIVDNANSPMNPIFPKKKKIVLIGLLFGLLGGVGLAIGIEYLNQTIKTSKDAAISTDLPILGVIPSFDAETKLKGPISEFNRFFDIIKGGSNGKDLESESPQKNKNSKTQNTKLQRSKKEEKKHPKNQIELIAVRKPQSIQSESYRSIRTSMLISFPPRKIKSILLTSPLAQEGKSSTISNLGITLAEANMRVVILDADLRRPNQNRIFDLKSNRPSLNQFLKSKVSLKNLVRPTPFPNLCLINCESVTSSPIGLLTSESMNNLISCLRETFDYVLIDTPPILAVSDALALSPLVDGVILVARAGSTPKRALKQAKEKLDTHKFNCFGVILNGVNLIEQDGYYARQYYHYSNTDKD
ncbi:GumC family protein [Acidobacteriota bacterium]